MHIVITIQLVRLKYIPLFCSCVSLCQAAMLVVYISSTAFPPVVSGDINSANVTCPGEGGAGAEAEGSVQPPGEGGGRGPAIRSASPTLARLGEAGRRRGGDEGVRLAVQQRRRWLLAGQVPATQEQHKGVATLLASIESNKV